MLKGFLVILLLLIIVFFSSLFYLIAADRGYINSKNAAASVGGRYNHAWGLTFDYPEGYNLQFATDTEPNILKRKNTALSAYIKKQISGNRALSDFLIEKYNYDWESSDNALYFSVFDKNVLHPANFWSLIVEKEPEVSGRSTEVNGHLAMEMTGPSLRGYYVYSKTSAIYLYVKDENRFNFEKSKALLDLIIPTINFSDSNAPKPKCPEGMCTYKDPKNRFTLKHPEDMVASNNEALQENTIAPKEGLSITSIAEKDFNKNIEITYFDSGRAPNLGLIKEGALLEGLTQKVDEIIINGQTAISYIETPKEEGWFRHKKYYIYKDGYALLLQNTGEDDSILDKVAATVLIN